MAASDSINALYLSILGRPVDAASLNTLVTAVNAGYPLAELAVILATSTEASNVIAGIYQNEFGRAPDPYGLDGAITYLAYGGSVTTLTMSLSLSPEAAVGIAAAYQNELGRTVDVGGLAAYQAYLGAGFSIAGAHLALANSPEAQADITATYRAILGRAPSAAELSAQTAALANGSLAAIAASLGGAPTAITASTGSATPTGGSSTSSTGTTTTTTVPVTPTTPQAPYVNYTTTIQNTYIAELGRYPTSDELNAAQNSLSAGTSQSSFMGQLASSAEAQADITAIYRQILSRAPSSSDLATSEAILAGGGTLSAANTGYSTIVQLANGNTPVPPASTGVGPVTNSVAYALATGSEATADITAAYRQAVGHGPSAVGLAAAQSELITGVPLTRVESEIAQLSGGTRPMPGNPSIQITPQTLGGSPVTYAYAALNNDAVVSTNANLVDYPTYMGAGGADITGFNPATDYIQIQSSQTSAATVQGEANINGAQVFGVTGPSSIVALADGSTVVLQGVLSSQLSAANIRVVS